nr:MAG TPA: hypothetical protein [Bacteriophage sp.]
MDIIIFLIKSKGNHRSNQRMFVNAVGALFFYFKMADNCLIYGG